MPRGRPASPSRSLLRSLRIDRIREIVDHYSLPRARSIEDMVDTIVRRVGRDLSALVSADGPFLVDTWNEIVVQLGGQPRRSFDDICGELAHRLDRVVLEFDMDEAIVELRDDAASVRRLAQLLAIDQSILQERLNGTHGRTLLGRFVSELRADRAIVHVEATLDDDDVDESSQGAVENALTGIDRAARDVHALTVLLRLFGNSLQLIEPGSGWPAKGQLRALEQTFDVNVYVRVVGGSQRGNALERRFQNPSQQSPIYDDPDRHELLFGVWLEQGEDRAVIVAFDAYRRIGKATRFSMFMPLSLLEQAADTGFAAHENTRHETIYAFRPENVARYIQALVDAGQWSSVRAPAEQMALPSLERARSRLPRVDPTGETSTEQLDIRPRVGMYAAFARLNYRPWFALAEFVDNSIQSFLNQRERLKEAGHDGPLVIDVNIEDSEISVTDRAGGIAWEDFPRAFSPAAPPADSSGLSEFGLGMKAAASWFARHWVVRTSALGEPIEREVTFDISAISREGTERIPIEIRSARESDHFTVIKMTDLRVRPKGRTLGKVRQHLASIYRVLSKDGVVNIRLTAGGVAEDLCYDVPELLVAPYYKARGGASLTWRKEFEWKADGKRVFGWAGIMKKGSHAAAGFSVFRRRRLIEGSIGETYKPHAIFGSPNSYASFRVIGELFVDGFDVSHTKDGIQWHGHEDDILESIRAQLASPDLPLLDQAEGYRSRKSADALPPTFGADALNETVVALAQPETIETIRDQLAHDASQDEAPAPPHPTPLQQRELTMSVDRDGKLWTIHIELIRDPIADFYSTSTVVHGGVEALNVTINLDHDFSAAFINDNEAALQPIIRLVAALAVGERVARSSGVKGAHHARVNANQVLRSMAAHGGVE